MNKTVKTVLVIGAIYLGYRWYKKKQDAKAVDVVSATTAAELGEE